MVSADSFMQRAIQKQSVYYKDVESFQPKESLADSIKSFLLDYYNPPSSVLESISLDSIVKEGKEYLVRLVSMR
jgi:hypothetical protein